MMAQVEGAHGEQGWIRTQDIRLPAPPVTAGGPGCGHPGMASFPSARPTFPGQWRHEQGWPCREGRPDRLDWPGLKSSPAGPHGDGDSGDGRGPHGEVT